MQQNNQNENKNLTLEELEQALEHDNIVDRELGYSENDSRIHSIMYNIENRRKEQKISQKKLASKVGICVSTYKNYLSGASNSITLNTVINIAHVLGCRLCDFMDEEH